MRLPVGVLASATLEWFLPWLPLALLLLGDGARPGEPSFGVDGRARSRTDPLVSTASRSAAGHRTTARCCGPAAAAAAARGPEPGGEPTLQAPAAAARVEPGGEVRPEFFGEPALLGGVATVPPLASLRLVIGSSVAPAAAVEPKAWLISANGTFAGAFSS